MTLPTTEYFTALAKNLATGAATEHTHRPALAALLEALAPQVKAVNEPKRSACGAPDLAVLREGLLVGHVEAKDVGLGLDAAERTPQLRRYREALPNLVLTDYLEFRWYVDGEPRRTARLGRLDRHGKPVADRAGAENVTALLTDFLTHTPQPIVTPRELAERMARLTHLIREIIVTAFANGMASDLLRGWRRAFAEVLVADLDQPEKVTEFADMFAQTLAYGLFSARVMDTTPGFTRQEAQALIPRTNPFLRQFFFYITGPDLEQEPYGGLVEDLVQLLAHTDMEAVLADFGQRTRQDDPVVHFYETFLAAYDPRLREARGVYYTPVPVVSFIVRSVDALLKARFDLPAGLADTAKVRVRNTDPGLRVQGREREVRKTAEVHRVLVLDPATGTATFLYTLIDFIREQFMQGGNAGMWSSYVREHLLPRLFGFELLMAPYAVAHFKLALQLAGHDLDPEQRGTWAYDFASDERIQVYLTNALEAPHEHAGLPLFTRFVADESAAADAVKQQMPIMVVMGNPPYAVSSANKGAHIETLMERYKTAVRTERNIQPLSDDYIKFIRFAHDRIERTGAGILGFITNHSYLSGLIHRGMREELLRSFDELYIVNLHGNALMGETAPDGGKDENVFDIRQGVAIALMVKTGAGKGLATVYYADLWGAREDKYRALGEHDVETLPWETLEPVAPHYFLVPKDFALLEEYEKGWSTSDIFRNYSTGLETGRDHELISFDKYEVVHTFEDLANPDISNRKIAERYRIRDTSGWPVSKRRSALIAEGFKEQFIRLITYRPFDNRFTYYHNFLRRAQFANLSHLCYPNRALITSRIIKGEEPNHVSIVIHPVEKIYLSPKTSNNAYVFPLYLYPEEQPDTLFDAAALSPWPPDPAHGHRVPNLNPDFVAAFEARLGLTFQHPQGVPGAVASGDPEGSPAPTFTPEDLLHYIYALLHSPTYRERYAEFLKIDFPRVPLTSDVELFRRLVALGRELTALHLMEHPALRAPFTGFPVGGTGEVAARGGYPKYTPPAPEGAPPGRVWINTTQYFEGVPEALWEFQIGGYQVLHKWLKDRRGRTLSYDDLRHYQQIVVALRETRRLMAEVDAAIVAAGGWPLA